MNAATRLNFFLFGIIGFISLLAIDYLLDSNLFGGFFGKLIFMLILSFTVDFAIKYYREKSRFE